MRMLRKLVSGATILLAAVARSIPIIGRRLELFNGKGGDAPEHISAEAVCSN